MCDAWRIFIEREREELCAKTTNTTQNAYLMSGVNGFDPYYEG
jgi:hypothetical protein